MRLIYLGLCMGGLRCGGVNGGLIGWCRGLVMLCI